MKALTIHEPYATLIRLSYGLPQPLKQYETRHWGTRYRGPVAIHAGASAETVNMLAGLLWASGHQADPFVELIEAALNRYDCSLLRSQDFPFGKVLCVANLTGCIEMDADMINEQPALERAAGFWRVGRRAWRFEVTQVFEPPIPAVGKQGLWEWKPPG